MAKPLYHQQQQLQSSLPRPDPRVLFLDGWSPGPLVYLGQCLERRYGATILLPKLPMPPFSGNWCEPRFFLLSVALVVVPWMLFRFFIQRVALGAIGQILSVAATLFATLYCARQLVAYIVRSSIQRGVDICRDLLHQQKIDLVVGFSWGGAVLAELVVQGLLGDNAANTRALLIAPTTAAIASITGQPDAALRVSPSTRPDLVHVVHGDMDGFFCPHPRRWQRQRSCLDDEYSVGFTMLRDNHMFHRPRSRQTLMDILITLMNGNDNWIR